MKRRTAILGLGGLVASSSALIGSGAFTSVEAERQVDVEVRNDEEAYLALLPTDEDGEEVSDITAGDTDRIPEAPAQDDPFAVVDEETGRLELDVVSLNSNAKTKITNVFKIVNQGSNDVDVFVDASFEADGDGHPDALTFQSGDDVLSEDSPVELESGHDIVVDITFDTRGIDPTDDIADTITVHGEDPNRGDEL